MHHDIQNNISARIPIKRETNANDNNQNKNKKLRERKNKPRNRLHICASPSLIWCEPVLSRFAQIYKFVSSWWREQMNRDRNRVSRSPFFFQSAVNSRWHFAHSIHIVHWITSKNIYISVRCAVTSDTW